jgi:hypothetical protein
MKKSKKKVKAAPRAKKITGKGKRVSMSDRIARIRRAFSGKNKGPGTSSTNPPDGPGTKEWLNFRDWGNKPPPFKDFANYIRWPDNK